MSQSSTFIDQAPSTTSRAREVNPFSEPAAARRSYAGTSLLVISWLHTLVGVVSGARIIVDPDMEALMGTRAPLLELSLFMSPQSAGDLPKMTMFWFMAFGVLMMFYAQLIRHNERTGEALPSFVGVHLLVLALGGGLMIPASGFWFALIPAYLILKRRA